MDIPKQLWTNRRRLDPQERSRFDRVMYHRRCVQRECNKYIQSNFVLNSREIDEIALKFTNTKIY